jgi:hypothetical protein
VYYHARPRQIWQHVPHVQPSQQHHFLSPP